MIKFNEYFKELIIANDLLEAILYNGYGGKVIEHLIKDANKNEYIAEQLDPAKSDSQYVDIYDTINDYLNTIYNKWIEEIAHV